MGIHPTAIIAPGAKLGPGVSIGPYAVIEADTEIGEASDIRANVVIKRFTTLGAANTVYEGAVLGGEPPAEPTPPRQARPEAPRLSDEEPES